MGIPPFPHDAMLGIGNGVMTARRNLCGAFALAHGQLRQVHTAIVAARSGHYPLLRAQRPPSMKERRFIIDQPASR